MSWNVLVTSQEGAGADLLRELRALGHFRWSPYRNVLFGTVEDPEAFLQRLEELRERKPFVGSWLGKAIPVEEVFPIEPATLLDELRRRLEPRLPRLAGRSFHVRVDRRGHKGSIHTHRLEQELGAYVVEELARRGTPASVRFRDPDWVVLVEIVGDEAGLALVSRETRERHPVVRVD
ncbi:MAG: hypothetical protein KatS3mg076_0619 [Candidatus Binatia bacterium]|nr:MAG: hypothetical protein KatS3mg076_0619 [Candidatus Binatia bacterium]